MLLCTLILKNSLGENDLAIANLDKTAILSIVNSLNRVLEVPSKVVKDI